jgi:hypothetical protein
VEGRIFLADGEGSLCIRGIRPRLRFIQTLELNHNDAWCRWRTVHGYRHATSHKKFAACILDRFCDQRSESFPYAAWSFTTLEYEALILDLLGVD